MYYCLDFLSQCPAITILYYGRNKLVMDIVMFMFSVI